MEPVDEADTGSDASSLLKAVRDLDEILLLHERNAMTTPSGDDRTSAAVENIRYDLREAGAAVRMLVRLLVELRQAGRVMTEATKDFDAATTHSDGSPLDLAYRRQQDLLLEITVLIKAIYQYLFGIRELLTVAGTPELSTGVDEELDRVLRFRNRLITHKQDNELLLRGMTFWNHEHLSVRFGTSLALSGSTSAIRRIDEIWTRVSQHLPAVYREERNCYLRLGTLYERINDLPGPARGDVEVLIKRYGVPSDTPLVLTRLLGRIAADCLVD